MPNWEMRKKYPTGGIGGIFKAKDGGYVRVGAFSPSALENMKNFLNVEEPTKEDCEKFVASKNRDEAVAGVRRCRPTLFSHLPAGRDCEGPPPRRPGYVHRPRPP